MQQLRCAEKADHGALLRLTSGMNYLHRHLDWRDSLAWLGRQPFWLCEENHQIQGALACPAEPEEVAWVRLFAVSMRSSPDRLWRMMFERCVEYFHTEAPSHRPAIASLALREWYTDLLKRQGFQYHQDIVVFMFDLEPPRPVAVDPRLRMREMTPADLDRVTVLDHQAFEPIWRLSLDDLRFAYQKSAYCTVIEQDGEVVGYQMSSSSGLYAHLARLAVRPDLQGRKIGYTLVQNLLDHFINRMNFWGVTLNTQHNNTASLALYYKIGFRETGERFPVFVFPT